MIVGLPGSVLEHHIFNIYRSRPVVAVPTSLSKAKLFVLLIVLKQRANNYQAMMIYRARIAIIFDGV